MASKGGREKIKVLPDRHVLVHAENVRHVADESANGVPLPDIETLDGRAAGIGPEDRGKNLESCGLARAIRPDKAVDVAGVNREGKTIEGIGLSELLAEIPDFDAEFRHC